MSTRRMMMKGIMMTRLVTACAMVAGLASTAMAQTTGTTNMEILRQKVKADKKLVVAQNLQLTDAEGTAFWPVYEAYQKDLQQLNQRKTRSSRRMPTPTTRGRSPTTWRRSCSTRRWPIDEAEVKLKSVDVPKILGALPATKAARYIQIENKIRAAIRYELADGIPLVQ